MDDLLIDLVINEHIALFGVEPVFTGINAFASEEEIIANIDAAIRKGEPYVEDDVPDGVDI